MRLERPRISTLAYAGVALAAWGMAASWLGGIVSWFGLEIAMAFIAILLAFALEPLVATVQRRLRIPRPYAAGAVFVALAIVIGAIGIALLGLLVGSAGDFVADLPGLRARLPELLARPTAALGRLGARIDLVDLAGAGLDGLTVNASALAGSLREMALGGLGVALEAALTITLAAFISADAPAIRGALLRSLPERSRALVERALGHLARAFRGFLWGQATLGAIYGLAVLALAALAGLPWSFLLAGASGVAMAIPVVGPALAPLPVIGAAILTNAPALPLLVGGLIVVTLLILNLVQPRLMAGAVGIHPGLVIVSVLVGGRLAGPFGAIFSLPIAAALVGLIEEIRHERARSETPEDGPGELAV